MTPAAQGRTAKSAHSEAVDLRKDRTVGECVPNHHRISRNCKKTLAGGANSLLVAQRSMTAYMPVPVTNTGENKGNAMNAVAHARETSAKVAESLGFRREVIDIHGQRDKYAKAARGWTALAISMRRFQRRLNK